MIYLPLSKSSWMNGRIGPERYQDCFVIIKKSIDLLNENKINKILLLSDFHAKKAEISEMNYMLKICKQYNVLNENIIIEDYGYDTLSQIKFTLNLCKQNDESLIIISSVLHYPRVVWICWRLNKKHNIKIKNKIGFGIPRLDDMFFDILLMFLYPVIDLCGFSENFSLTIKRRRNSGIL